VYASRPARRFASRGAIVELTEVMQGVGHCSQPLPERAPCLDAVFRADTAREGVFFDFAEFVEDGLSLVAEITDLDGWGISVAAPRPRDEQGDKRRHGCEYDPLH